MALSQQAAALSRLKRMSSAWARPAAGAAAAQPDHFAAAMGRLRREQAAGGAEAERPRSHANTGVRSVAHTGGVPTTAALRSAASLLMLRVHSCMCDESPEHHIGLHVCAHGAAGISKGLPGQCSSRRATRSRGTGTAGGVGQGGPGQQRLARWDPCADREDCLALERLTQRAVALSGHPSPAAVRSS